MNLYAKITTSKGKVISKADNHSVSFELTAGKENTVMLYGQLICEESDTEKVYKLWNGDICVDTYREAK